MRVAALLVSSVALLATGCGAGAGRARQAGRATPGREPAALLGPLEGSRWMPESVEGGELIERLPDGTTRYLLGRLRVETSPDGSVRRARTLLPPQIERSQPSAMEIPERLGTGWLFTSSLSQTTTTLWRARDFLAEPELLATVPLGPMALAAGPDRFLARSLRFDRVIGIQPATGALVAPIPLPAAPRYAGFSFVDARRGIAIGDLVGTMVTNDAGATWRPLSLPEPARSVSQEAGSFVLLGTNGRYVVDATPGATLERAEAGPRDGTTVTVDTTGVAPRRVAPGPLGDHPLRAAVEDGWPLLDGTAIVARGGKVSRVRLADGQITATAPSLAAEDDAICTAVRFGVDVGFVCGAPERGTSVYAWVPPLGAELVARFSTPRAVAPSHSGSLVVRGPCGDATRTPAAAGFAAYCVVAPGGQLREVLTRGDIGVERVIALADGRVVVLVPPRGGTEGQLTILPAGSGTPVTHALVLPDNAPALRRGLWLEGGADVGDGELAFWVESGGELTGLRVKLDDGTVVAGPSREDARSAVVSGTHALAVVQPDAAIESVDGGLTWRTVDIPSLGMGRLGVGVRCGPVGCTLPFDRGTWERVGWDTPADEKDLAVVEDRGGQQPMPSFRRGAPTLRCDVLRVEDPKPEPRPKEAARKLPVPVVDGEVPERINWVPYFGKEPPTVGPGYAGRSEMAVAGGDSLPAGRIYGWSPKGVNGARSSRYVARFLDKFEPDATVRSSAVSVAPWHDVSAMSEAVGPGLLFKALVDPGGRAAVFAGCRANGRDRCDLYGAVEGRGLLPLPDSEEEPYLTMSAPSASIVWTEETFYVALNGPAAIIVWKIDGARSKVIARVPRVVTPGAPLPRLVRRAHGREIGLLVSGLGAFGVSDQEFYVLPLDPDTGAPRDIVTLGPIDLGGVAPRVCGADDDGWLFSSSTLAATYFESRARVESVELRVRADHDHLCAEALGARLVEGPPAPKDTKRPGAATPGPAPSAPRANALPLTAIAPNGRKLVASCSP